jgi:hypothetical protein
LAAEFEFGVEELGLDPGAAGGVVADGGGVEEFGEGGDDFVVDGG